MIKSRLVIVGAVLLILVVVAGYWLGTADFTDDLEFVQEEKQPEEKQEEGKEADEDNTGQ